MSDEAGGRSAPRTRPSLDDLLSLGHEAGDDLNDGGASGSPRPAADKDPRSGSLAGASDEVFGGADDRDRLVEIPIDAIVPNEFQPRRRFDASALDSLSDSIRALGVLQPVIVRPLGGDGYELIAGERRWRAAQQAGLAFIPAVIRIAGNRRSLEEAIVENLHREDLNAIEEAAAYQQLIEDFALTQDEVATRVGKSRSAVTNTLRLFQLPASVQRMVMDGELSAGHARALVALGDEAAQRRLAAKILTDELSVREVEALIKATSSSSGRSSGRTSGGPAKSVAALEVERLLADRLETRVDVVESSGNGRIVLRYADADDLDRILRLMLGADRQAGVDDR